jgi:hypothetical protein
MFISLFHVPKLLNESLTISFWIISCAFINGIYLDAF